MTRTNVRIIVKALLLACAVSVIAASQANARVVWLCKPGLKHNPCDPGLRTTVFSPSGEKLRVERPRQRRRKVDCFYVYPTVSDQQTTLANRRIDPEERSIALYQAARYSQYCRVFAPMYRQRTLKALFSGGNLVARKSYLDVLRAWRTYLRRYNRGRPFVIIGHSQGTFVLRKLVAREIDRKRSVRRKLLSALLLGGNVIRGEFKHIPACRSRRQLRCVVAFSTYGEKPPAGAIFGQPRVLCTNPTALGGGSGLTETIFPSEPFAPGTGIAVGIQLLNVKLPTASTPWIAVRRAYRARCTTGKIRVLRIIPREGAPTFSASPIKEFGLHLVDANIALGNLIRLVRAQALRVRR
jgi:hypothetical protein